MVEIDHVASEVALLRTRLSRFLANHSRSKLPLRTALRRLEEHSWTGVIFGGVLRDLALFGNSEVPRDVDVVVSGTTASELEHTYRDILHRKNRFGGLQLRPRGWLIDIWALQDSWPFKEKLVEPPSFDRLVRTTFLNVEAVAIQISSKPGLPREIYSSGFFEAIKNRVLDISFEPNPFPQLCVVRALISALRLNFGISRRLGEYLVFQGSRASTGELIEVQESHYGTIRVGEKNILEYLSNIDKQLANNQTQVIQLPATRREQLELSHFWSPAC